MGAPITADADATLAPALAGVVARYQGAEQEAPEKRKPGRPLKRSDDYLRELLKAHREVVAWFIEQRGGAPRSDVELYTAFFGWQFESNGQRAARTASPDFRGALKTLRNELAEARRLERVSPGNGRISGTPTPVK
jgi:hypothetical protein